MQIGGVADNIVRMQGGRGLKFDIQNFNVTLGERAGGLRSPLCSLFPLLRARLVFAVELRIVTQVGFGSSCKRVLCCFRMFCVKLEVGHANMYFVGVCESGCNSVIL